MTGYSFSAIGPQAFVYSGGVMTGLGDLPGGGPSSYGYAIYSSGPVTGQAINARGYQDAFLYSGGVMAYLGCALPGANFSDGSAINASGEITGELAVPGGDVHAILYSGGLMKDLGTLPGLAEQLRRGDKRERSNRGNVLQQRRADRAVLVQRRGDDKSQFAY